MSKRIIKETKEVEKAIYNCDICDKEYRLGLACSSGLHHCIVCKRDICNDCSRKNPFYDDWGDTSSAICKDCEKIVKPFVEELDELSLKHEKETKEVWKRLQEKVK